MSVERMRTILDGGNMKDKVRKKDKMIRESVDKANNIARFICRKFDLEIKTSKNEIIYFYVDCSVDVTDECKVSNYEKKFAKAFVLEYTLKQYNILTGDYEPYIWFALYEGNLVCKPVYTDTGKIIDINLDEIIY